MKAKLFKEKLNKKTPLLMSPFGFALAAWVVVAVVVV